MKKIFNVLFILLCFSLTAENLTETNSFLTQEAETTLEPNLEGLIKIECTYEPATQRNERKTHQKYEAGQTIPHLPLFQGTSLNWCGYAAATTLASPTPGSVKGVAGSWAVPQLKSTVNNTYCSFWVGIDGYSSPTVEQIGTEHDWINGVQVDYAWYEMYPNPSFEIVGFPVNQGDVIRGWVQYIGANQFRLTLINYTRNVYTTVPETFTTSSTAQRSSAEWICESPSDSSGILPLADYRFSLFTTCLATINGLTGSINNAAWQADPLTLITSGGATRSLPSQTSADGQLFTVVWQNQ